MQKTKPKSVVEEKRAPRKERISQIYKRPKEKFLTQSQEEYWKILDDNQITLCFGPAGTGKSHVALKKALDLLWDENNRYEKIIIVKPAVVAGSEIGFLKGSLAEKMDPFIYPSFYLIQKIVGKESFECLKEESIVEVLCISYSRGLNIDNSILVLEEAQNTTPAEMKLLLTRIGFNTKMFISGDVEQSDKFRDKTKSGLYDAKERLSGLNDIGIFEFSMDDIVRNPLITQILERYNN